MTCDLQSKRVRHFLWPGGQGLTEVIKTWPHFYYVSSSSLSPSEVGDCHPPLRRRRPRLWSRPCPASPCSPCRSHSPYGSHPGWGGCWAAGNCQWSPTAQRIDNKQHVWYRQHYIASLSEVFYKKNDSSWSLLQILLLKYSLCDARIFLIQFTCNSW